ncbi:MAG: hypothetical protein R2695_01435 [Acidimicrobiales bacterium]
MDQSRDDLDLGAFTDRGPWVVHPETMRWRRDVAGLRRATQRQLPSLVTPPRLPPDGER